MKKVEQPVVKVKLVLPNGVKLVFQAYPKVIYSSNRVDSKAVGLDWESIYVQIGLDWEGDYFLVLVTFDIWEGRGSIQANREAIEGLAEGLGSVDYADTMLAYVYQAYDEVMSKK